METMNTEEIRAFLATHPPFDALDPELLAEVAATATVASYAPGEAALVEDAAPAEHLFVVRDGLMELVHEGEVVDVLEPGESFGHPSLLTGRAPAFTVRARRKSSCYLIPRERALEVFSGRAGASYVAATLRELARPGRPRGARDAGARHDQGRRPRHPAAGVLPRRRDGPQGGPDDDRARLVGHPGAGREPHLDPHRRDPARAGDRGRRHRRERRLSRRPAGGRGRPRPRGRGCDRRHARCRNRPRGGRRPCAHACWACCRRPTSPASRRAARSRCATPCCRRGASTSWSTGPAG